MGRKPKQENERKTKANAKTKANVMENIKLNNDGGDDGKQPPVKIKKKRGRKPKPKPEKDINAPPKIPKKRGRKPKGGKIIKLQIVAEPKSN